jgi:hypothetical protein
MEGVDMALLPRTLFKDCPPRHLSNTLAASRFISAAFFRALR